MARVYVGKQRLAMLDGSVEAGHEHLFHFRCRHPNFEHPEGADLGYDPNQECHELGAKAGLMVLRSPFLFITRAGEIVEKLLARDAGNLFLELGLFKAPGYAGHTRNDRADAISVGAKREGQVSEDILHFDAISIQERALQHRPRHLKPDETAILVRRVASRGHLEDVEAELRPDVRIR